MTSDTSEKLVALTPEDIAELEKVSHSNAGCWITAAVASVLGLYIVSLYIGASTITHYILITIGVIVAALCLLMAWVERSSVKADIRENRKKVIAAPMESQRERTYTKIKGRGLGRRESIQYEYYITVDGKEYKVNMELYYKLKPGDFVEIHLAPRSNHVLKIIPHEVEA
jgi:hypothetical protein